MSGGQRDGARAHRRESWWWRSKKRLALPGRGKRGGARTLVATNKGDRWFFLFGFEKNERANITVEELDGLRVITRQLLGMTSEQLDEAVRDGSLQEICHDQKS